MGIFKRSADKPRAISTQIRSVAQHPFGMLENYVPLGGGDIRLYRAIREAVPVLDAAVMKIIRLTGGFCVCCGEKKTELELNEFLRTVKVGRSQRGINAFLDNYLDSLLTCGRAVGELVTDGNREIEAVLCGNVCDVQVREGLSPLDFVICGRSESGSFEPLPFQNLIMFTPFNPEADSPYGVSLFRSMPFLAEILLKIYNSIGINWERAGNIRYAVVYKPQGDIIDKTYAKERSEQIAKEWSAAMQSGKNGSVRDFVAIGNVDIKVIGADSQVLDSEVPVRQILEQLISRTGIPPFMLGLSWSSTERMSAQQADLMTSELTAVRRTLTPVIEQICDLWLRMHGRNCHFEICWEPINLQDAVEEAKAALYEAQAAKVAEADN
ncbi:MAG: serine/threonine protein phosphatase [Oscillospiraceae bacterium]|nr:serine/threonine protein phosphatase [Oscillospiraceae bacterium]